MKLHLIRHAKAESSSADGMDFHRKLSSKGIVQSRSLATYVAPKISNCEVWCSSANRTRSTLDAVLDIVKSENIHYHDELYLCSTETFLKMIWGNEGNEDLLIVAHNFGISDLLNYFTGASIRMRTAEYICLQFDCNSWNEVSKDMAEITDQYRP